MRVGAVRPRVTGGFAGDGFGGLDLFGPPARQGYGTGLAGLQPPHRETAAQPFDLEGQQPFALFGPAGPLIVAGRLARPPLRPAAHAAGAKSDLVAVDDDAFDGFVASGERHARAGGDG